MFNIWLENNRKLIPLYNKNNIKIKQKKYDKQ